MKGNAIYSNLQIIEADSARALSVLREVQVVVAICRILWQKWVFGYCSCHCSKEVKGTGAAPSSRGVPQSLAHVLELVSQGGFWYVCSG